MPVMTRSQAKNQALLNAAFDKMMGDLSKPEPTLLYSHKTQDAFTFIVSYALLLVVGYTMLHIAIGISDPFISGEKTLTIFEGFWAVRSFMFWLHVSYGFANQLYKYILRW